MKKKAVLLVFGIAALVGCNDTDTKQNIDDSVDKADSANERYHDTAMNEPAVVIDENSTTFLVRAANATMTQLEMAHMTQQIASTQSIKNFASMLAKEQQSLQQEIKSLATAKHIILPGAVSNDDQKDINELAEMNGRNYDKAFINKIIDRYKDGIRLYDVAAKDAADVEIQNFANNSLVKLRMHLDSAQALKKRYW
jgi:putative membrane protein